MLKLFVREISLEIQISYIFLASEQQQQQKVAITLIA